MPTAFLLMDSTYGTDDRCHDDSSELGSIAWLFLYTYVITCVCSTSAARSPPPCSAAAAVLVITHVLFTQLPLINIFSKHFPLSLGALLQGTGLARAAHDCCCILYMIKKKNSFLEISDQRFLDPVMSMCISRDGKHTLVCAEG